MDGVVHGLPDLVFGHVHALLHVATGLELRLPELTNLGQDSLEVVTENATAALLRHVLRQEGVSLVRHTEQRHHLQPGQLGLGQAQVGPQGDERGQQDEGGLRDGNLLVGVQQAAVGGVPVPGSPSPARL